MPTKAWLIAQLSPLLSKALSGPHEVIYVAASERQRLEAWYVWCTFVAGKHVRKFKTVLPTGGVVKFTVAQKINPPGGDQ